MKIVKLFTNHNNKTINKLKIKWNLNEKNLNI